MEAPKPESAENVDQSGVQVEHVDASGAEVSKPNTKDANQPPKTWREFAVANNGSGQGHEMVCSKIFHLRLYNAKALYMMIP